jgi:hypothetical protein
MAQGVISVSMTDAHRPREPCGDDNDGAKVIRGLDRLGSSATANRGCTPILSMISW